MGLLTTSPFLPPWTCRIYRTTRMMPLTISPLSCSRTRWYQLTNFLLLWINRSLQVLVGLRLGHLRRSLLRMWMEAWWEELDSESVYLHLPRVPWALQKKSKLADGDARAKISTGVNYLVEAGSSQPHQDPWSACFGMNMASGGHGHFIISIVSLLRLTPISASFLKLKFRLMLPMCWTPNYAFQMFFVLMLMVVRVAFFCYGMIISIFQFFLTPRVI